jgi:hypothetical protein
VKVATAKRFYIYQTKMYFLNFQNLASKTKQPSAHFISGGACLNSPKTVEPDPDMAA